MSSFSGLSTALSSLIAQRQALEVAGQNIANSNTVGYTRQRADMTSVQALSAPSMYSAQSASGNGVRISGIARLGDVFLDARLRAETASAGYQSTKATTLSNLQSTLTEPADNGLSAQLNKYWTAWQGVSNNPQDTAARRVLLGEATSLVTQVTGGYRAVETQWSQVRTETDAMATEINTTAQGVANLNEQIRSILVSGGSPNELIDQRNVLVTTLSGLTGASGREHEDGTIDVMVGGNALVRGVTSNAIKVTGSFTMAGGIGEPPASLDPVGLVWASTGTAVNPDGGTITSYLADLAPASGGGVFASAIAAWNQVATTLHDSVNAVHTTGQTVEVPPAVGGEFFSLAAGVPAALSLKVAITDPRAVAAGNAAGGALDGSVADKVAQLGTKAGGPDQVWREFVVDLGVQTRSAVQRAGVVESARATAENLQLSQSSVDLDEESTNMLAYQRAYEGAARVLTTIDAMLDTLINRTGLVGR